MDVGYLTVQYRLMWIKLEMERLRGFEEDHPRDESGRFTFKSGKEVASGENSGIIKAEAGLQERFDGVLPNGEQIFIPQGAAFSTVKTIAGKGSNKRLRSATRLSKQYGGNPIEWEKKVGSIITDLYVYDVHWYQNVDEIQHEVKLKKRVNKK